MLAEEKDTGLLMAGETPRTIRMQSTALHDCTIWPCLPSHFLPALFTSHLPRTVKILEKNHIKKEKKTKYVMTEKEVFNSLDHPFIVKLYYTFQDAEKLCASPALSPPLFLSLSLPFFLPPMFFFLLTSSSPPPSSSRLCHWLCGKWRAAALDQEAGLL